MTHALHILILSLLVSFSATGPGTPFKILQGPLVLTVSLVWHHVPSMSVSVCNTNLSLQDIAGLCQKLHAPAGHKDASPKRELHDLHDMEISACAVHHSFRYTPGLYLKLWLAAGHKDAAPESCRQGCALWGQRLWLGAPPARQ